MIGPTAYVIEVGDPFYPGAVAVFLAKPPAAAYALAEAAVQATAGLPQAVRILAVPLSPDVPTDHERLHDPGHVVLWEWKPTWPGTTCQGNCDIDGMVCADHPNEEPDHHLGGHPAGYNCSGGCAPCRDSRCQADPAPWKP